MTVRRFGHALPRVAGVLWMAALLFSIPASALLVLLIPEATADEVSVVVATPLLLYFLYAHAAAVLRAFVSRQSAKTPASRAITLVAWMILAALLAGPAGVVYAWLGIAWALPGAVAVCFISGVVILGVAVTRRLAGGARSLSRLTMIPAALVVTVAASVVHVSSAVSLLRPGRVAHHRA